MCFDTNYWNFLHNARDSYQLIGDFFANPQIKRQLRMSRTPHIDKREDKDNLLDCLYMHTLIRSR
jgi:hypothetical protein